MAANLETCLGEYLVPGVSLPAVRRTITRDGINAYRAASGDDNRIHHDDDFAARTRFGGVIAHGMLTLALISEMMTQTYGADWLGTGNLRVRFRGAAYPDETLEASGSISKCEPGDHGTAITCNVEVRNANSGDRIITGAASLMVANTVQQGVSHQ